MCTKIQIYFQVNGSEKKKCPRPPWNFFRSFVNKICQEIVYLLLLFFCKYMVEFSRTSLACGTVSEYRKSKYNTQVHSLKTAIEEIYGYVEQVPQFILEKNELHFKMC